MPQTLDLYLAGEWTQGTGDRHHRLVSPVTGFWETFQPFGGAAGTDTGWGRGGIREFTDLQTLVIDLGGGP